MPVVVAACRVTWTWPHVSYRYPLYAMFGPFGAIMVDPIGDMMNLYTTKEAVGITGATFRQVDYWTRQQIVRPAVTAVGTGSRRLYDDQNLMQLMVFGQLSRLGLNPGDYGHRVAALGSPPLSRCLVIGPDRAWWMPAGETLNLCDLNGPAICLVIDWPEMDDAWRERYSSQRPQVVEMRRHGRAAGIEA